MHAGVGYMPVPWWAAWGTAGSDGGGSVAL